MGVGGAERRRCSHAASVSVVGEFNDWSPGAHPMRAGGDGSFYAVIELVPGRSYCYRYLLDGDRWENDRHADSYAPNEHGATTLS